MFLKKKYILKQNLSFQIFFIFNLSGYDGISWSAWIFNAFFIYLINFIILGGCLIKMLVYGDSVPKSQSKEAGLFYKHKKLAENYLKKVTHFNNIFFP